MKKYIAIAKRWENGWELHIPGIGVTQSYGGHDAEEMVRDYIEMTTGERDFEVEIDTKSELKHELSDDYEYCICGEPWGISRCSVDRTNVDQQ